MAVRYNNLPEPSDLLATRLWRQVAIRPDGCWEWTGKSRTEKGYGLFMFRRKLWRTHRVSYLLYYGVDPQEYFVCHVCDNPSCVNPLHLFLGTSQDNMNDKCEKGRQHIGTHFSTSKLTPFIVLQIRKLWASKQHTQSAIAKMFGVHRGTVLQVINGRTWNHVKGYEVPKESRDDGNRRATVHRRGSSNVNARLTPTQVLEIRRLWDERSWTLKELGEKFGVDISTIGKITTRANWKWLENPQTDACQQSLDYQLEK